MKGKVTPMTFDEGFDRRKLLKCDSVPRFNYEDNVKSSCSDVQERSYIVSDRGGSFDLSGTS